MIMLVVLISIFSYSNTTAQTLKGRLLFSGLRSVTKNPAKNIKVILVPRNTYNDNVTSQLFFYGDDARQLKTMQAKVTSTNGDGYYFFNSIPRGSYILKVCIAYGVTYKFRIKEDKYNIMLIPDMLAAYNNR